MANTVGHTIRSLRASRNETLSQVARATGLSIAMLSRIERGERSPSPTAVLALARHFGLPPHELMGEALAERICARYGHEPASWAAVLLVRTARPRTPEAETPRSPDPAHAVERTVADLARTAERGDRDQAISACVALRRLADAPLRALQEICDRHPDAAVRSAAAALLDRGSRA
ncbi:MAG: helix-turn-helix transcriptional regulator [Anaerosomatales bacterium]|nr:helix-turn-helix transcriptional regulator [Anaerosomatales bacterium]